MNISVLVQTEGELELRTTPHSNPLFLEGLTYARRRGNGRHCIRKDAIRIVNTEIKGWIQGSNFKNWRIWVRKLVAPRGSCCQKYSYDKINLFQVLLNLPLCGPAFNLICVFDENPAKQ